METEHIDFPRCPKCARPHRFKLAVERSFIVKFMARMDTMEQPRRRSFTRLFTCPDKNEEFEATFVLTEPSSVRIEKVTVGGITDGNDA